MYCSKCGTLNQDNAMFCKNCGASLLVQAQAQAEEEFVHNEEIKEQEPVLNSEEANEEPKTSENPVLALIKKHSSSTLFLVATILFTVSLGLSLILSMFGGMFSETGASLTFSTGFISVSSVLALIGLWKINTMNKKQGVDKTGFVLLKVTCIIELVTSAFVFGLVGLLLIVLGAFVPQIATQFSEQWSEFAQEMQGTMEQALGGNEFVQFDAEMFFNPETVMAVLILTGIILMAMLPVIINFYCKALKTINRIKDMADKGVVYKNITNGLIIWLFILGGISASALLAGDMAVTSMGVAYILYAITLINFKNETEKLLYVVEPEQTVNEETQQ